MKKRWVVVPALVGLLAIGIVTGGAVLAHGSGTDGESRWSGFVSRVAAILELDEDQVEDALTQAAKEMREEALKEKLDSMVAEGRITQDKADEYLEWVQSKPEGLNKGSLPGFRGHGFGSGKGYRFRFHRQQFGAPQEGASGTGLGAGDIPL